MWGDIQLSTGPTILVLCSSQSEILYSPVFGIYLNENSSTTLQWLKPKDVGIKAQVSGNQK